jgi:hypothetical protein
MKAYAERTRPALSRVDIAIALPCYGLTTSVHETLGTPPHRERRHALTRDAVAIARQRGDSVGLAQVLSLRALSIEDPFMLAERRELTAELAALAEELASSELAWHAANSRAGLPRSIGNRTRPPPADVTESVSPQVSLEALRPAENA